MDKLPRYNFNYYGDIIRIKDEVDTVPVDFTSTVQESPQDTRFDLKWWTAFMTPILIMIAFFMYFA